MCLSVAIGLSLSLINRVSSHCTRGVTTSDTPCFYQRSMTSIATRYGAAFVASNGTVKQCLKVHINAMQCNSIQCNSIQFNSIKSYQIKSNQIKSNQIKSNQIKSNQIKSIQFNQIKSNQTISNQIKSNQIKSNQIKSNHIKSNHIISNHIKSYQIQCSAVRVGRAESYQQTLLVLCPSHFQLFRLALTVLIHLKHNN